MGFETGSHESPLQKAQRMEAQAKIRSNRRRHNTVPQKEASGDTKEKIQREIDRLKTQIDDSRRHSPDDVRELEEEVRKLEEKLRRIQNQ